MPHNVRFVPQIRLKNLHVCLSCRSALAPPAARLPHSQQKRWITRTHISRIKEAMEDWERRAESIRKGEKQSMLSLLEERGFVNQIVGTREDLDHLLTERRVGAYCGVDPTGPSLHVGHLVPFMVLGWLYIHGYSSVFLLGGTTGKIGDPTDRLTSRTTLRPSERKANLVNIHLQLKRLGEGIERYAARKGYKREWAWRREVANNSIWYTKLPVRQFMRLLGGSVRMGPLLGRDSVKTRLQSSHGMPFDEFSYPLLQAWDWWELFQKGAQLQIGGADQFGNILTGAETIKAMKKIEPVTFESNQIFQGHVGNNLVASHSKLPASGRNINEPMGFTVPLLTTSAGVKFGKTEGNAIWLDSQLTSTFDQYQFFVRSADADVEKYLKLFTFLPMSEIRVIMDAHRMDESKRVAQHRLAFEFIELIHGLKEAENVQMQHKQLFTGNIPMDSLRADPILAQPAANSVVEGERREAQPPGDWNPSLNPKAKQTNAETAPSARLTLPRSLVAGQPISKVLWCAGLVSSRGEGYRLIANKGCHVGSQSGKDNVPEAMGDSLAFIPATNPAADAADYLIDQDLLVIRIGKWKVRIVKIVSDEEYEKSGLTCPGWKEREEKELEKDDWKKVAEEIAVSKKKKFYRTVGSGP